MSLKKPRQSFKKQIGYCVCMRVCVSVSFSTAHTEATESHSLRHYRTAPSSDKGSHTDCGACSVLITGMASHANQYALQLLIYIRRQSFRTKKVKKKSRDVQSHNLLCSCTNTHSYIHPRTHTQILCTVAHHLSFCVKQIIGILSNMYFLFFYMRYINHVCCKNNSADIFKKIMLKNNCGGKKAVRLWQVSIISAPCTRRFPLIQAASHFTPGWLNMALGQQMLIKN